MKDLVWLSGEAEPFADVELISEGARELVFTRGGERVTVPARAVRAYRHGDTPPELDHALQRMERGDFAAAERLLAPLVAGEGWVRAHAGFHRANARRLRAELEGTGHAEGLQWLAAWRAQEGEHWLAPLAAVAEGDAALAAGQLDVARAAFERLAGFAERGALTARLGLARVALARLGSAAQAAPGGAALGEDRPDAGLAGLIGELETLEEDALVPGDLDTVLLARVARAGALSRRGAPQDGLELLLPLLDTPGFVRSPWQGAVLNAIPELIADLAGRAADGSATREARVAASYFVNRALRYGEAQPLERARTLALAVEVNTLSGREDIALMARTELGRRFPTSCHLARLRK